MTMDNATHVNERRPVFLVIDNLTMIASAFGNDMARAMSDAFEHRLRSCRIEGARWRRVSSAIFVMFLNDDANQLSGADFEDLWVNLAARPFAVDGRKLLATLSLHSDLTAARAAARPPVQLTEEWAAAYGKDMALAAGLVDEIAQDRLLYLWQAVRNTAHPDTVLHYEMSAHTCDDNGRLAGVDAAQTALVRIGLGWVLDRALVLHAVKELEADARPVIAVRLSQQGLCQDWDGRPGIWFSALQHLSARPDVAARLVVEMAEGHGIEALDQINQGFQRFKQLGASVSVAGFASSALTFAHLLAIDPDFVKISPVFLHSALQNAGGLRRLQLLINLASTLARDVIVEGMDDERQLQIARSARAEWAKGALMGRPGLSRRWMLEHDRQFVPASLVAVNSTEAEPDRRMIAFG